MRKTKGTVLASAVLVVLVAAYWVFRSVSQPKRLVTVAVMRQMREEYVEWDKSIAPAQFRLPSSKAYTPRKGNLIAVIPSWRFAVFTNSGSGCVRADFQPEIGGFEFEPSGTDMRFFIHDVRLVDCEWKIEVTRSRSYELTRLFGFKIDTSDEVWESETMPRARKKWKEETRSFALPDWEDLEPALTNVPAVPITNWAPLFESEYKLNL